MDSMMAALKARRGQGGGAPQMSPEQAMPEQEGGGMQDLLSQLSPEQKSELHQLLTQDLSGDTSAVSAGAPASGERGEIEEKMGQQESEGDMSDDVQMGMLDRNSLEKAEAGVKPRGLGDRAKMAAASKLKSKGKLK